MCGKDCKIVCGGKEMATISCSEDGIKIQATDDGKKFFSKMSAGCCEDCC
ncbi:hypothetical protein ACFLRF_00090 [Candidatus Altiarchaeota archaeon]